MADAKLLDPTLSKEDRKKLVLKAQQAKEAVFKLVVKIISWETGSLDSIVIRSANKISNSEWLKYKKNQLEISAGGSLQKAKEKLAQTYTAIKKHGGFE